MHPFGRHCIGYKSAGEIDVLDAVDHVIANYPVDRDRVALMGFSMGGAGAWHMGAHYADRWAVVHAGAGFVDVRRYQRLTPAELPPEVERILWGAYDVPAYARNLLNIPVVAYSGEVDRQKDAADFMGEVLARHGPLLPHFVGPDTGHKYHPETIRDVAGFVKDALREPRDRNPTAIHLQTRTLRYPRYAWLEITGLMAHWIDARLDAVNEVSNELSVNTENVSSFRVAKRLPPGTRIRIDGTNILVDDAAESLQFRRGPNGGWSLSETTSDGIVKKPGLQGPIDDAFLAPFLVVAPSGRSTRPEWDRWVEFELNHFKSRWRALFRGDLRVVPDHAVTPEQMARFHLVLFGTPESNRFIADVLRRTALTWPDAEDQVLLGISPNPDAPGKYVVLNSGPTFREADDRTNSLQNPKLGDWAIIDITEPPGSARPGRIVDSGFFDEAWRKPLKR